MLRQFLAKFLIVVGLLFGGLSWAFAKTQPLYLSFEQRLAMTYAMMAYGQTPEIQKQYLDRAQKYFMNVAALPVQKVKVRNFEEFMTHFRGQWPDTQSLHLDLNYIEKDGPHAMTVFESDSPRVQHQIDQYTEWQEEQLKSMAHSEPMAAKYAQSSDMIGQALMLLQNPQGQELAKEWALKENDALFAEKMKEFDHIGEKIASTGLAQSEDVSMRIVMQTMLTEYFSRLSLDSKKMIVSGFLGGDLQATDMQKFELMVQNSGPQLQKLLQIIARQGDLNPDMLKVFKTLEDAVRPVPWRQVQEIIATENGNYQFLYFEQKPLGVGTMAQVHRAKILVNGQRQDVVVRFIKPDIEKRVQEDARILAEVATILDSDVEFQKTGAPKLSPIVSDLTATVMAELNQQETIERQKLAATRYDKTVMMKTPTYKNFIEFHVPGIYPPAGKESRFMVQELVIGKKLDKEAATWNDLVPELKKSVIEELAKLWSWEVLFGGGFYHSDLHQGNFMVQLTDERIRVNILDFGMGGVISPELQRQVMMLGAGVEVKNADIIARAFWKISNKSANQVNEAQLKSLVAARLKLNIKDPNETSIDGWTKWAMNQGLRLPYDFISLNRGIVIINKLLQDAGSPMSLTSILKYFAFRNPGVVYKRLVVEEKMSPLDLIKLGWMQVTKPKEQPVQAPVLSPGGLKCEGVFL